MDGNKFSRTTEVRDLKFGMRALGTDPTSPWKKWKWERDQGHV